MKLVWRLAKLLTWPSDQFGRKVLEWKRHGVVDAVGVAWRTEHALDRITARIIQMLFWDAASCWWMMQLSTIRA